MTHRHVVVMLTTSYPRFPGDTIGTFMEPIARGIAARGHEVHVVLPWHPRLARGPVENGVHFHPFRYAPHPDLNVFGYAAALEADVHLRAAAWAAAPLALAASWRAVRRVARRSPPRCCTATGSSRAARWSPRPAAGCRWSSVCTDRTCTWPSGTRSRALPRRPPCARLDWLTACSDDLRDRMIALGADPSRATTIPYGVDAQRFRPDAALRAEGRRAHGRRARRPGAVHRRAVRAQEGIRVPDRRRRTAWRPGGPGSGSSSAGAGISRPNSARALSQRGIAARVSFPGVLAQDEVAAHLAGADLAVVPSVRDEAGNVDGLPNTVMEALASGTALVATRVGGIPSVIEHGRTGWLVAERDAAALESALDQLLADRHVRAGLGSAARADVLHRRTWEIVAEAFEQVYDRAADRAERRRKTG